MKKILIVMTLLMSIMNARNYDIVNVPCFTEECVKQSKEYEEKHDKKETEEKYQISPNEVKESNKKYYYPNTYYHPEILNTFIKQYGDCLVIETLYENGELKTDILCINTTIY